MCEGEERLWGCQLLLVVKVDHIGRLKVCQEVLVLLPAVPDLVIQLWGLEGTEVGGVTVGNANAIL